MYVKHKEATVKWWNDTLSYPFPSEVKKPQLNTSITIENVLRAVKYYIVIRKSF